MKKIPITQGYFAIVDDDDFEYLSQYQWSLVRSGVSDMLYAERCEGRKHILMHHVILGRQDGVVSDHVNLNGLDNRRCNLRYATYTQNRANEAKKKGRYTSRFKGVSLVRSTGQWRAQIKVNYRVYYLGIFYNENDAAKAYNDAAIEKFGIFARLNELD